MFRWKDNIIYDDLFDVVPAIAATNGMAWRRHDVFGFIIKDRETIGEDCAFLYRCRQVESAKRVGSGEQINSGDRLYAYPVVGAIPFGTPQLWEVSPNPIGTPGTSFCFCGWAKYDAGPNDTTVIMNFDGTRPEALL
jgi:hypothetical protein